MRHFATFVTVCAWVGMFGAGGAQGQSAAADPAVASLQKDVQQLRKELDGLKADLQHLRKLITDLQASATGSAPTTAPSVTLSQIDKKLDRIVADVAALKKESGTRTEARRPAMDFVGKAAPAFALTSRAGVPVSNADFAAYRATVLNFVAPSCGFCAKQIPKVERVRGEFEPRGVRFVNVSEHMGEKVYTPEEAETKFAGFGSNLELAMDPENKVGQLYKATAYPTMFVVRSDGVVAQVNIGAKDNIDDMLRQQLAVLVGDAAPVAAPTAAGAD